MQPDRKVQPLPLPGRLESWKEIAAYLNRSERTVRRWEEREELPVHRLHHDKRGSVYAFAHELDEWRASRRVPDEEVEPEEAAPRGLGGRRGWAALAAVVVALAAIGIGVWMRSQSSGGAASSATESRGTANDEAWRLYQLASFGANAGRVQIETAIRNYQEAIRLDPSFARAWSGLATAHMAQTWMGETPATETMGDARREAEQALALDPSTGRAMSVLGWVSHYLDWNHQAAEAQFRRGIAASAGGDAVALSWYADFLVNLGRFDEARVQYARAHDANPRWLEPLVFAGNVDIFTGRPAPAILQVRRALETEPNFGFGNHFLGRAYLANGDYPQAIEYLRKSNDIVGRVPFTLGDLGFALARAGERDEAERMLQDLRGRRTAGYYPAFPMAAIELGLGNRSAALDWLERAAEERHMGFYMPSVDRTFDELRAEPRFQALMRRMNLPASPPAAQAGGG